MPEVRALIARGKAAFSFALAPRMAQTGDMEHDLAPGQRFRARDRIIWEISEIARTHDDRTHVALVKPEDRLTVKVISVDALFDKRLFSAVE